MGPSTDPSGLNDSVSCAHDDALAEAAACAARLGVALVLFQNALTALRDATPKCGCGWAEGHRGAHRVTDPDECDDKCMPGCVHRPPLPRCDAQSKDAGMFHTIRCDIHQGHDGPHKITLLWH